MAAAAALLLIITGLETWQPTRTEDDAKAAAAMQVEGQGRGGEAVNNEAEETTPQRQMPRRNRSSADHRPPPPEPQPEPDPELIPPEQEPDPPPPPAVRKERPPLGDQLRALDAEAQRQLAAGDLAAADKTLVRLIRRAVGIGWCSWPMVTGSRLLTAARPGRSSFGGSI